MKVVRNIGKGGFGSVDEVIDFEGNRYAKKTFAINQPYEMNLELRENVEKRFIREAKIQANFNHPNIVSVTHSYLEQTPPSFCMPLAYSSLADDIYSSQNLNGNYLEAIMDILAGLEELHSLGIYHRDLKPQNVLRFNKIEYKSYAISDFGLMSISDTQLSVLTTTGMRMGSDMYTAPEITTDLKRASVQSDIYSIGCILHDFVGTESRIPCNEIIDPFCHYSDIIRICTRRDPGRRFTSVADLRDAILSVSVPPRLPASENASVFLERLESSDHLDITFWKQLVGFIGTAENSDTWIIFNAFSIGRIEEICATDEYISNNISNEYCLWVENNSFSFSSCDGLASRLVTFFNNIDDLESQVNLLFALLKLGTSHNRWYVEREFARLCGTNMNYYLAKRFGMEIRVKGSEVCSMFYHLKRSINFGPEKLHPDIYSVLKSVCAL